MASTDRIAPWPCVDLNIACRFCDPDRIIQSVVTRVGHDGRWWPVARITAEVEGNLGRAKEIHLPKRIDALVEAGDLLVTAEAPTLELVACIGIEYHGDGADARPKFRWCCRVVQ